MIEEIDFKQLSMEIPALVKTYPVETQREIYEYLSELDELDKMGYKIALNHLGSSFNILRSNGFKEWKKSKK